MWRLQQLLVGTSWGRIIDVTVTTALNVSPPGPEVLLTSRLLGPYVFTYQTPNFVDLSPFRPPLFGPELLAGSLVMSIFTVATSAWTRTGAGQVDLWVGAVSDISGYSDANDFFNIPLRSTAAGSPSVPEPWTTPIALKGYDAGVPTLNVKRDYPLMASEGTRLYAYVTDNAATEMSDVTGGGVKIWALVGEPA